MNLLDLMVRIGVDDQASQQIGNISKGIRGGLSAAAKAGAIAIGAASTAVVAFGKSAVDAGMSFDSSMSQVAATMGYAADEIQDLSTEAGQNFAALRDFAQEMGASTMFSASQAADALNYMALAGYDAQTSMDMLPNVLNLAAAGGIELATASDMVTDAQSALGLTLDETATMVDQMAAASSRSNTSVAQLGEAILTVGATAGNMAGGTQELATMLGVLADNGIKGAEGGTHLRNMILSLQNPTTDGVKALQQLGVSVYDADGNMRSMVDIFTDMQAGMQGMDQASRDAMVAGIFNRADMAAVNAMLNTSTERFDELSGAIGDSAGAAERMAGTQMDNLQGDLTIMQSALEGLQIALSDKLTPGLRDFVQLGTDGLSRLSEAIRAMGEDGDMSAVLEVVDDMLDGLLSRIDSMLPPILEIATTVVTSIAKRLPKIVSTLIPAIVDTAPQLASAAFEVFSGLGTAVLDALPLVMDAVSEGLAGLAQTIADNGPEMMDAMGGVIERIGGIIIEHGPALVSGILSVLASVIATIVRAAPDMAKAAVEFIGGLITGSTEEGEKLHEWANELPVKLAGYIVAGLAELVRVGGEIIESIISGIEEVAPEVGEALRTAFEGVIAFFEGVGEFLADPIGSIQDGFESLWDSLTGTEDTAKTSMDGFEGAVEGATSKAKADIASYNRTKLNDKNATVKATGNAVDGTGKTRVSDMAAAVGKLHDKTVNLKATGNAVDGTAKSNLQGTLDLIGRMRDKTINVTTKQRTVTQKSTGSAWGGIHYLAEGGIRIADRFGPGVSIAGDVRAGERGAEAIVPLTSRYGGEFARIMGQEAGKYIGGMSRGGNSYNLYYNGEQTALDMFNDLTFRMQVLEAMGD